MKLCIEPSAGVGVACVLSEAFRAKYPAERYATVGVILCGGNLDLANASRSYSRVCARCIACLDAAPALKS